MKRTITKSALVLVGTVVLGTVYIPTAKPIPDTKFINSTYIRQTRADQIAASEKRRKDILSEIHQIRIKMREMAQLYKSPEYQVAAKEKTEEMAEKLCTDCFQLLWRKSEKRIAVLVSERAKQLGTKPQFIKIDQLVKRKGIVLVDFEEFA